MSNPSKRIGTETESRVVNWLRQTGFPDARREVLHGSKDQGDIVICASPLVIAECKGGKAAEQASAGQIVQWMTETETEAVNAGADLAALIVRRWRRHVEQWDVWLPATDWVLLVTGESVLPDPRPVPLRGSLVDFGRLLRGWVR